MKIIVKDKFRKNELSFIPGGVTVELIYENGSSRVYDKVKNSEAFICVAKRRDSNIVGDKIY